MLFNIVNIIFGNMAAEYFAAFIVKFSRAFNCAKQITRTTVRPIKE